MEAAEFLDNQMQAAEFLDNQMQAAEFLVHCQTLLDERKTAQVLNLLQDDNSAQLLNEVGWELVGLLCQHLNNAGEENRHNGEENRDNGGGGNRGKRHEGDECEDLIERCLQELLKRCSTKEMILGLNEHIASECSVKSFTIAMHLCKQSILLLQRRQSKYLENICKHSVTKMKYLLEQSKEVDSAKQDKDVDTAGMLLSCALDFINGMTSHVGRVKSVALESFLCECTAGKTWQCHEILSCREVLVEFVFNVIELFVEWGMFVDPLLAKHKETLTEIIELTFSFMSFPDLLYSLKYKGFVFNSIGTVIVFYLLFVEQVGLNVIPVVYTYKHLFCLLNTHISTSLESPAPHTNRITIALLIDFLEKINNATFSLNMLVSLQDIGEQLTKTMIWSQDTAMRKQSQDAFLLLLQKMKLDSQYVLLQHIYKLSDHPGLLGYLIGRINSSVEKLVERDGDSVEIDVGELAVLFTQIEVGKNNVLHESDRYMSALSFLRFWLLRDRNSRSKQGVWRKLKELNKNMSVMSTCIAKLKQN